MFAYMQFLENYRCSSTEDYRGSFVLSTLPMPIFFFFNSSLARISKHISCFFSLCFLKSIFFLNFYAFTLAARPIAVLRASIIFLSKAASFLNSNLHCSTTQRVAIEHHKKNQVIVSNCALPDCCLNKESLSVVVESIKSRPLLTFSSHWGKLDITQKLTQTSYN